MLWLMSAGVEMWVVLEHPPSATLAEVRRASFVLGAMIAVRQ